MCNIPVSFTWIQLSPTTLREGEGEEEEKGGVVSGVSMEEDSIGAQWSEEEEAEAEAEEEEAEEEEEKQLMQQQQRQLSQEQEGEGEEEQEEAW